MRFGGTISRSASRVPLAAWMAGVSWLAMVSGAQAQLAIGETTIVQNDVKGSRGSTTASLGAGDDVFANEIIRTGAGSLARIDLIDATSVSVAGSSQLTLDKFVYNGDHTAKSVTFNAVKGSFRFVSGTSPSNAYKVVTPEASIGVRGTIYDVRILRGGTDVVLASGEVKVCMNGKPASAATCVTLNQPGQGVTVTRTNISTGAAGGGRGWSFNVVCEQGGGALCSPVPPAPPPLPPPPEGRPDAPLGNNSNNGPASPQSSPPPPPPPPPPPTCGAYC